MATVPEKISQQGKILDWTNGLNNVIDYITSIETAPRMSGSILLQDSDDRVYELKLLNGELVIEEVNIVSPTRSLRVLYDNSAPTSGYFYVGDRVENTNPVPGGYMGWVCITEGYAENNPGNFRRYGLIES